jgi:hypothetical protein
VSDHDADTRISTEALRTLADTINAVPPHLSLGVICSFVLTVCAAQDDPAEVLDFITRTVDQEIQENSKATRQ